MKKISNEVPLVFDEAQQCHQVLTSLKYFEQDYKDFPVIATGSMVRLSIKHENEKNREDIFFSVGKIKSVNMYPMTFDEYFMNANSVLLERIKTSYNNKLPLEEYEHELALNALYEYLSIGGFPEVVVTFLDTKSYVDAAEIIKEVYDNYLADMDTYNVSNETILKTRNIYNHIFSQMNKDNKNFKISQIDKGKSNRDYFNAYQWLELARVVYRCIHLEGKVDLPLMKQQKTEGLFRLYLSDVGMFVHQSHVRRSDFFVKEKRNVLSGIFFENYVADELAAKGIPLYYWTGKNESEFEFVVDNGDVAIPIDVKKKSRKLNSLEKFRQHNKRDIAIKISANQYGYDKENMILTIPLYEVLLLAQDLSQGVSLI